MKQLKKSKRSIVLPVKGNTEAVAHYAESYQRDAVHEAIRQGLEDVAHGRTRPAHEVFDEIRRKHGETRLPPHVPTPG